ncbi:hypothetical protein BDR06DRAFT_992399 [Suillus hirtellus]|nr:hypothetical protein BDR06DRAFT_992399 [Suillus hirtellus]
MPQMSRQIKHTLSLSDHWIHNTLVHPPDLPCQTNTCNVPRVQFPSNSESHAKATPKRRPRKSAVRSVDKQWFLLHREAWKLYQPLPATTCFGVISRGAVPALSMRTASTHKGDPVAHASHREAAREYDQTMSWCVGRRRDDVKLMTECIILFTSHYIEVVVFDEKHVDCVGLAMSSKIYDDQYEKTEETRLKALSAVYEVRQRLLEVIGSKSAWSKESAK